MRHRTITAIAVTALLALAGCEGGDGPPPGEQNTASSSPAPTVVDPTGPDGPALLDLVRAEGTVSIIVEAALDGQAERGSDEHERLVAEARDALEVELDPEHTTITTRFQRYPWLTMTVDEEGLLALFASSRVTHIWENRSVPLE